MSTPQRFRHRDDNKFKTSRVNSCLQTFFGGRQPFTSRAVRWLIARFILSRAKASAGLTVGVEARSNREAVSGRFDTVSVEFQELIFDDIQVREGTVRYRGGGVRRGSGWCRGRRACVRRAYGVDC